MATYYAVGAPFTWDGVDTTNWSLSSGGAGGAGVPGLGADAVIIDDNSGTGAITTASGAGCLSCTLNSAVTTLTLGANLTATNGFTLTKGAMDLGTSVLTSLFFNASNANTRSVAFGGGSSGYIVVTGNDTNVVNLSTATNFTYTGTSRIDLTYSGGTGTRTVVYGGGGTEANAMNVHVTAGTDNVHTVWVRSLNFTGFTGTWLDTAARTVHGDLTLGAGMSTASGTNGVYFSGTGSQTITSNGVTINTPIEFDGAGGTRRLGDALTVAATRTVTFVRGTFDFNNQNASIGLFSSSNANARTLTLGSGTITITGAGATAWNTATSTNLTVTASTATITMTSASAKTFAGGTSKTWPILNQGGAGALTITATTAITFTTLSDTTNGTTITLPAGVTTNVTNFSLGGASAAVTTLQSSSAGSAATLSKASGTVTVQYLSIKDSTATGGAQWLAPLAQGNVNVSGNSGWQFLPAGGARAGIGMGMGLSL